MELEKGPSLPAQSSSWSLVLLGILSFLALFTSKPNQADESVYPQGSVGNKDSDAQTKAALTAAAPTAAAPTAPKSGSAKNGEHSTPLWEKAAVLIALGVLSVNTCQMRSTEKAARAAETANKNAQAALTISEQANVTIGRPDGVIADIIWPKGKNGNAALVVYFQNSGHLPARFNWGNDSPMIANLPADPKAVKEPYGKDWSEFTTDHWFRPMWRAKRKDGKGFGWSGTIMIAGNSSHQGVLWEIPKERMLQLIQYDRPFAPHGKFEYCDGFHNHVCRRFTLNYAREPFNRFFLGFEDECAAWEMQVINPEPYYSEYLPPCETSEHREELGGAIPGLPQP